MFGWKGRIGMLIPTNNTVIEPEMALLAPEGVTYHTTRMISSRTGSASIEGLHNLVSNVDRAAEELSITGVDAFLYGCLSTSFAVENWDREFTEKVAVWSSKPAITALSATCAALKAFGLTRTTVLCPYGESLKQLAAGAFKHHGITLDSVHSINVTGLQAVCRVPEDTIFRSAREVVRNTEASSLCILATDLTTVPIIAALEEELGIPVVSTNQALSWASQNLIGVSPDTPLGGNLFQYNFSI